MKFDRLKLTFKEKLTLAVSLISCVAILLRYGYSIQSENSFYQLGLAGLIVFSLFLSISVCRKWETGVFDKFQLIITFITGLFSFLFSEILIFFLLLLAFWQFLFALKLLAKLLPLQQLFNSFYERPVLQITGGFLIIILFGALLLSFQISATVPGGIGIIDALFTSTSAVCVTGLIVRDTPVDFSGFGQLIILLLFQIGGLGFMTLSTFSILLITGRLSLKEEMVLEQMSGIRRPQALIHLVKSMILITLLAETIGAVLIFVFMQQTESARTALAGAWEAIFHSVSAFCNAGFSLNSNSLEMYQSNPGLLLTVSALIITGGIGFMVISGVFYWIIEKKPLNLHTKICLITTGFLLLVGTFLFLVIESDQTLKHLDFSKKIINSFFQSTTTRTAGFNSVSIAEVRESTAFFMIFLMFIGAAPGSTGGGIKITTAAIMILAVKAALANRQAIVFNFRTIPSQTVFKAIAVATMSALVISISLLLLLVTQQDNFQNLMFEAVSAFGTVGLSTGATAELDQVGKFIIIFLMYTGRLGPLTLLLLLGTGKNSFCQYPIEEIQVG